MENFSLNIDLRNNIFKLFKNNKVYKLTKNILKILPFKNSSVYYLWKKRKSLCTISEGKFYVLLKNKNNNNILIILSPYKFTEYHFKYYELGILEKKLNQKFEIHGLSKVINLNRTYI